MKKIVLDRLAEISLFSIDPRDTHCVNHWLNRLGCGDAVNDVLVPLCYREACSNSCREQRSLPCVLNSRQRQSIANSNNRQ
jgi:hypothetical protein